MKINIEIEDPVLYELLQYTYVVTPNGKSYTVPTIGTLKQLLELEQAQEVTALLLILASRDKGVELSNLLTDYFSGNIAINQMAIAAATLIKATYE